MGRRRKKLWSHSEGSRPYVVRAFERVPGGALYLRTWDPERRSWVKMSLKHRDKERAKDEAQAQSLKLRRGMSELLDGKVTLKRVLDFYSRARTLRKSKGQQKADATRSELWKRVLGPQSDPHGITLAAWESFIHQRASGEIDARGNQVPDKRRRRVGPRTVEADCRWLRQVFGWATVYRAGHTTLMRTNPLRIDQYMKAVPHEQNPNRPIATQDRFDAVRAVSDQVMMEKGGKPRLIRSYLSELLDIVNGTARRITAVCRLRYEDLVLARSPAAPFGGIRWPRESDKQGREWFAPIDADVRTAIDRVLAERPGLGSAWLFPHPRKPERPIDRDLAKRWLRRAEGLADLEPQKGGAFHPYRRKWATERKGYAEADIAAAGGWGSVEALRASYVHADSETTLQVVLNPTLRLRDPNRPSEQAHPKKLA